MNAAKEPTTTNDDNLKRIVAALLDAVKQCQIRFGGRAQLATESDSCVSCLCAQFEQVFNHGLKKVNFPVNDANFGGAKSSAVAVSGGEATSTTMMHVRDVMSTLNLTLKSSDSEPAFWYFLREFLNRHEQERYMLLKNVTTDCGRGRAWLRSSLNEHSLERYIHMFLGDSAQLCTFYEESAFMRNQEMSNVLPNMAAGLGSILFAISIDNASLNSSSRSSSTNISSSSSSNTPQNEPKPVIAHSTQLDAAVNEKRKKKRVPAQIVSFDDEEMSYSFKLPVSTVESSSAPPTCLSSPAELSNRNFGLQSSTRSSFASKRMFGGDKSLETQSVANSSGIDVRTSNSDSEDAHYLDDDKAKDDTAWDQSCDGGTGSEVKEAEMVSSVHDPIALGGFACMENVTGNADSVSDEEEEDSKCSELLLAQPGQNVENVSHHSVSTGMTQLNKTATAASPNQHSQHKRIPETRTEESQSPLTPITDTSVGELFPVPNNEEVHSEDSLSIPSYSEDTENAAVALALVQKASHNTASLQTCYGANPNNCSLGASFVPMSTQLKDSLTEGELKQALLTIMQKKDELEEQNRSLRSLLDKEMEMCAGLRIENADLKKCHQEKMEKMQNKLQTLCRENELLKHQLRKYVGAVQMLKRDGTQAHEALTCLTRDGQPGCAEFRNFIDYHFEASEYKKKLIQVAEMHGELMEFNERLHRLVSQKEFTVRRLREELVDLRGPLPDDNLTSDDDMSITSDYDSSSMTAATRALINLWIPSVFLTGKSSDVHHVYQVYIRIRDDEWNIYRRYAQFYALHKELKRKDAIVNTFDFPPKKVIGNKDAKFVEERRKRLQHYLRCVLNLMVQSNSDLVASPDKETLTTLLPFFGEYAQLENRRRNRQRRSRGLFSRSQSQAADQQQSCAHYTGL